MPGERDIVIRVAVWVIVGLFVCTLFAIGFVVVPKFLADRKERLRREAEEDIRNSYEEYERSIQAMIDNPSQADIHRLLKGLDEHDVLQAVWGDADALQKIGDLARPIIYESLKSVCLDRCRRAETHGWGWHYASDRPIGVRLYALGREDPVLQYLRDEGIWDEMLYGPVAFGGYHRDLSSELRENTVLRIIAIITREQEGLEEDTETSTSKPVSSR